MALLVLFGDAAKSGGRHVSEPQQGRYVTRARGISAVTLFVEDLDPSGREYGRGTCPVLDPGSGHLGTMSSGRGQGGACPAAAGKAGQVQWPRVRQGDMSSPGPRQWTLRDYVQRPRAKRACPGRAPGLLSCRGRRSIPFLRAAATRSRPTSQPAAPPLRPVPRGRRGGPA
jgi:hypothetical protein